MPPLPPSPIIAIDDSRTVPALTAGVVTDLAPFFADDAKLVGVAIPSWPPEKARPHVLEAHAGLYELTDDGAELVFDLPASRVLGSTGDGSPPGELTDVAFHSGDSRALTFALTAENDGFLLSLPGTSLTSHFCYFPATDSWDANSGPSVSQELIQQGVPVIERTEAVAVNERTGQILAQPRTIRIDSGDIAGSELFVFNAEGGQPVGNRRFDRSDFVAGGAALLFQERLVLGSGAVLYLTANWADDVRRIVTLSGVQEVTGIAIDPSNENLIVLDGPSKRLFEFDALQIAEAAAW